MDDDERLHQLRTFLDAQAARPEVVKLLEAVLGIVDDGRTYLRAWKAVGAVTKKDPSIADLAMPFFVVTAVAHLETATLHAAKLTDRSPRAVSLLTLFACVEAYRVRLPSVTERNSLKVAIAQGRARLQDVDDAIGRVKQRRDQRIAHLDRRALLTSQDEQVVDVADLGLVFDAAESVAAELQTACEELRDVHRFSLADASAIVGPEGLGDLLYFTRAAFDEVAVPSPNPRVEKIREWDRHFRRVRAEGMTSMDSKLSDSERP